MPVPTHATTGPHDLPQFEKDIKDVHLIYDYDAKDSQGNPEKWRYEMYEHFFPPFLRILLYPLLPLQALDLQLHNQVVLLIQSHRLRHPRRPHGRTIELPDCELSVYSSR